MSSTDKLDGGPASAYRPQSNQPRVPPSPLLNRLSGTRQFASQHLNAEKIKESLCSETYDYIIGPMPICGFLDLFLPNDGEPMELDGLSFRSVAYDEGGPRRKEAAMYQPLIDLINGMQLPSVRLTKTAFSPDKNFGLKVDIGVFKDAEDAAGNDFANMESWIEFKLDGGDPFQDEDKNKPFVRDTEGANGTVGQLISYAAAHMGSSFRTHTLSVLIFGSKARLIRWDRAGVVVSESFDYTETNHLVEFWKRFGRLTPEQRGTDMSVSVPSSDEEATARDALAKEDLESSEGFEKAKALKFAIQDGEKTKYFIGFVPSSEQQSVVGRNTRGAPAFEIETGNIRYLKDAWRPSSESSDLNAEANSYSHLHKSRVRNIMEIIAAGDVCSQSGSVQSTFTDTLIEKEWVSGDKEKLKKRFQKYIHYRLVLEEVGRDLMSFESTEELLGAIINAIEALLDAYFLAGIQHRDISPRNIVIDKNGKGKLIDWDLCRPRQRKGVYTLGYTGTWQFVSGLLLQDPHSKYHDLTDDLESFLHVLTWTLVCYSESTLNENTLAIFLERYDEELLDRPERNHTKGGRLKSGALGRLGGYLPEDFDFKTRPGLTECIHQIADLFFPLYVLKRSRKPEHEDQISRMTKSREENGGVDMINIIKATMEKARVLKETQPEKWPANDKAEKRKVAVNRGTTMKKAPISYSKLSTSKRSRSQLNANCRSSHLAADPMHSLQESGVQDIDGEEEEDIEEDRVQKKARMARK